MLHARVPLLLLLILVPASQAQCVLPGMETFDAATTGNPGVYPAGWTDGGGTFPWAVGSGSTPTIGTGPAGDHTTGSGNYMYCETSFPAVSGDTFILQAPCFDATGSSSPTLEFAYHMYGPSMGNLGVFQFDGAGWNLIWCMTGDHGDVWKTAVVPVVPVGGTVTVRFRYVTTTDPSGIVVYQGDAAIDDVYFGEPTSTQIPDFQENQPALSVDINDVFGDANTPAVVSGTYYDCGGTVTPFGALLTIGHCLAVQGHELAINPGNAIPFSASGLSLPDGQVLNLDTFFPTVFLYGGMLPAFVPLPTNLNVPVDVTFPVDLTLQGVVLNAAAPLGITLSAANELHVAASFTGAPSLPGPQLDEAAVTLDVTAGASCWSTGVPFFGTTYTQIHVMDNGRVRFDSGGSDFTPTPLEAAGHSMVGMWTDLNTGTGGGCTVSNPASGVVQVDYLGVNYYGQAATSVTFHIELDTVTGDITIGGLTGVEQLLGASRDVFLGISPGGGAFDPASVPFLVGGSGGPSTATDMTYQFSAASFVPSYVAVGGDRVEFLPGAGGYTWFGF